MIPSKLKDYDSALYQEAEANIQRSIADIGQENHVEYAAAMKRTDSSETKRWLWRFCNKLFRRP